MKIVLPKTLAEPLTIPWELIALNDDDEKELVKSIKKSLRDHLYNREWVMNENYSRGTRNIILSGLRLIARSMGGLDVAAYWHQPKEPVKDGKHVAHSYHVLFRTRKDGPIHSASMP